MLLLLAKSSRIFVGTVGVLLSAAASVAVSISQADAQTVTIIPAFVQEGMDQGPTAWSGDGSKLYSAQKPVGGGNWDLYSFDIATSDVEQITFSSDHDINPHEGGNTLVWERSTASGSLRSQLLYRVGDGPEAPLTAPDDDCRNPRVDVDGDTVVFERRLPTGQGQIMKANVSESGQNAVVLSEPEKWCERPDINNGLTVWIQYFSGPSWPAFVYGQSGIDQPQRLTVGTEIESWARTDRGDVVFLRRGEQGHDVFLLSGGQEMQVTFDGTAGSLELSNGMLVYSAGSPPDVYPANPDVYMWTAGTGTVRLTTSTDFEDEPVASPNGDMVGFLWSANEWSPSGSHRLGPGAEDHDASIAIYGPPPIPALGTWGLGTLALAIGSVGVVALRRRRIRPG